MQAVAQKKTTVGAVVRAAFLDCSGTKNASDESISKRGNDG